MEFKFEVASETIHNSRGARVERCPFCKVPVYSEESPNLAVSECGCMIIGQWVDVNDDGHHHAIIDYPHFSIVLPVDESKSTLSLQSWREYHRWEGDGHYDTWYVVDNDGNKVDGPVKGNNAAKGLMDNLAQLRIRKVQVEAIGKFIEMVVPDSAGVEVELFQ